ncbi:hypothetical protein SAMN05216419_100188 [Nitrosomonas cryotolerans]|uniref:hypothetical protein n=1 Tax=Nitrosomonas cryotolerans TaxID=44575 RepID=UPI0008F2625E|nr:hypothetical protein [Nitrosomonas cryotolerans]SFP34953.1 hypothetical protein SAMN05216419_100188 [Nitrosomonas cryotolerans]
MIFKELVSVDTKESASGNRYFQGGYNDLAATVRNTERFAEKPGNWAYLGF